jgi:hypothetical protein
MGQTLAAMRSFVDAYKAARVGKSPGMTMGPEAIEKAASTIRQRELPETGLSFAHSEPSSTAYRNWFVG